MKTAVVTDSTAYLTQEELERYNIHMIPLSVHLEEGTFEEEVEIPLLNFMIKYVVRKYFQKRHSHQLDNL